MKQAMLLLFARHCCVHWAVWLSLLICSPNFCVAQQSADRVSAAETIGNGDGESNAAWQFEHDLFQMLLEDQGVEIVSDFKIAFAAPRQSIIVLTGTAPAQFRTSDWQQLVSFVNDGGHLLIASDRSGIGQQLGRFGEGPVTTRNKRNQYQGFDDCLLVPMKQEFSETLSGVSQVVTNRSGWFVANSRGTLNWDTLVSLPEDCSPGVAQGQSLLALGRSKPTDGGLVLVSADASVFTNGMMWHGDNAIFAIRVSEILTEGEKSQLLFVSDNRILNSFRERLPSEGDSTPMPDLPLPEPELKKALRLGNAIMSEIGNSNVLNEALRQQPRYITTGAYFTALLVFAAILFGVLVFLWLRSAGYLRGSLPVRRKMMAAFELESMADRMRGDYRNAAGYLSREFCWDLSGSRQSSDWQQYFATVLANPGTLGDKDRRGLREVVDIACRGSQHRMTRLDFEQLGGVIERLSRKLEK